MRRNWRLAVPIRGQRLVPPSAMSPSGRSTGAKLIGTASARAGSLGLTAIATTLVMRELGPAEGGTYYVIITIATTAVAIGHLSVTHAYVYLWDRGHDRHSLGANAVGLGLLSGSIAALAAWLLVQLLGPRNVPIGDRYTLLAGALIAVPAGIVLLYLSALLALDDRIGRVNTVTSVGTLVPFGVIVALYATGSLTLGTAVVVWVLFSVLPALGLTATLGARPSHLSRSLAVEALKVGCQYHIATISLFLLLRVDIFILNAQVPRSEVGLYALAVALVELTFVFTDSLAQVILPRQVGASIKEASAYTAQVMRTSLVVSTLLIAGIVISGPILVPLLFGEDFQASVGPVYSLAPGVVAFATIRTVGGVLVRLNRPLIISGATVGAMAINIVLNILLIPHLGILGAGIASSTAYLLLALFYTVWLISVGSLAPRDFIPKLSDLTSPVIALRRKPVRERVILPRE